MFFLFLNNIVKIPLPPLIKGESLFSPFIKGGKGDFDSLKEEKIHMKSTAYFYFLLIKCHCAQEKTILLIFYFLPV
jgi:hypothetical protein